MSNNPSTTTKPFALRLSNEVVAILERRIRKNGSKWSEMVEDEVIYCKVSDYIKERITTDALRRR